MKIRFWGTRGSIAVPGKETTVFGGNTTCLEIVLSGGTRVIIDAGTGIRALGDYLLSECNKVSVYLLVTHIHWDHVLGFPFFAPVYCSNSKILIDGFPSCMKGLRVTFDTRMGDGFFPVKFDDLKSDIHYLEKLKYGPMTIENTAIDCIPLQHPQGGFGFRFREKGKTLVFITDNELRNDSWEGRHPRDYAEFCRGADILIHDAQYTPVEREKRHGWGHSDYAAALSLAANARVGRFYFTHHDPTRRDTEVSSILAKCRDIAKEMDLKLPIDAAVEGSELIL
ncbi:MAG: MBL fold metallo-hydrolase [Desulfobacteraceae bacterium]|jgi:phosphoribosyl 1,2-cyclic phosphodiesterase|nr:MAG: MBL fold metallo-hydrolase [Desulfobacteraceae bacterium]